MDPVDWTRSLAWEDLPDDVRRQARRCLMDLVGVAIGGAGTELSRIICDHAAQHFGGTLPLSFDGRPVSPPGYALALGMTIDALDGHDGFNPSKGHIGCGLLPGLLAVAQGEDATAGSDFLTALVAGYELGSRLGPALHASTSDYHTSGAWVPVAIAGAAAPLMRLDPAAARHAMGIAEYHGPRSQMMRCIDHPTMLKDGSGWGAMAGVSALYLARDGFTGAPALTAEEAADWSDLGRRWLILEQYHKPYPVCRWAQPPVEAVLALVQKHDVAAGDVAGITVDTFHEATRLAVARPQTTEEAQYSTSFPVAVALVRGGIGADDLQGAALTNPEVLRISDAVRMRQDPEADAAFPAERRARVTIRLRDGTEVSGGWHRPRWDADAPATEAELRDKFLSLSVPVLGQERSARVLAAIDGIEDGAGDLVRALAQPINASTTRGSAA